LKNNELDYASIFSFLGEKGYVIGYTLVVIFIITAVSNGANITDGIDGLAAGTFCQLIQKEADFYDFVLLYFVLLEYVVLEYVVLELLFG
jgi:hypothetical protein